MAEWTQFRQAIAAGLPNAELLTVLHSLECWLDLGLPAAVEVLNRQIGQTDPQLLYRCIVILNFAIQREAGIPAGAESGPALQKLFEEARQGTASEVRAKAAAHLPVLWELGGTMLQKFPAVNQPPSAADLAKMQLQQSATAIFQRMDAVSNQLVPGTVTEASIQTIEAIVRDAKALAATAESSDGAMSHLLSMIGGTARTLAGCYSIVGRNEDALKAFADAATHFESAGEPDQAKDCRSRASDLEQHLAGSLDAAAQQPLSALSDTSTGVSANAWDRVNALMKLSGIAGTAADTFEAQQNAEAAAKILAGIGYPDPGGHPAETTLDSWIQTACKEFKGTALLRRVSQVSTFYDSILGARFAVLVRKDPVTAVAVDALQTQLQKASARMREEASSAVAEAGRQFARYFPAALSQPTTPQPSAPPPAGPDFEATMDRMRALDAAILRVQQTCNERADAGAGMDDLLEETGKLEQEADTLNSSLYEAKARLERAYILLKLGRGAELGPAAREARRRLLGGRVESLSSFAQAHERYYYLDSLNKEAMSCVMTGDFEGSLRICEDTVRDFETERYRVNSEYRQSALLSWVADFYKWAAFSAFKLSRWDNMLGVIDLIKARSAIRSRLIPDTPQELNSNLQREFDEVNAALEREPKNENFRTRRRQLWDLLSIAQTGGAADVPTLTVASVQAALEKDEALIGYFWLAESVILTVSVDRERFHAERIILKPDDLSRLQEFVAFIQTLRCSNRKMDATVAKLGDILLPPFLRDFMKTKKRIIFSPHHSLHLFPFHAARWGDAGFVGTEFAVRYVPNFVSVLLPWAQSSADRMLAIGIRDFADQNVLPLANVEDDAMAIAACYRAGGTGMETLLGRDATRERIEGLRNTGVLQQFRCVHLGTHGLSVFETPDQPLESRLLVQNGALDAMDIANLRLNAELVMLSACHSGQRAIQLRDLGEVPGDDIFGLQSALFRSGVRSIVGTLWLVETKSASPLTRAFHKHYARRMPAEVALQLSVKEYLENAPSLCRGVYYWAPYFISSIGRLSSSDTGKGNGWQN